MHKNNSVFNIKRRVLTALGIKNAWTPRHP